MNVFDEFDRLSQLSPEGRELALEQLAQGDPQIAAELRTLFRHNPLTPQILLDDGRGILASAINNEKLLANWKRFMPSVPRYLRAMEVGRGGMGVVHAVRDRALDRVLAMKLLHPGSDTTCSPAQHTARFVDEARVMGQLDHPGVVPIHDIGIDESGRPFFTMRMIHGDSLAHAIELHRDGDPQFSLTHLLQLILRVCETMEFAHSRGVIHRDLKPSNIMTGDFGEVYVVDWGVARVNGERDHRDLRVRADGGKAANSVSTGTPFVTMDGAVIGTPHYMSPEQARGDTERLNERSDVYAIGSILYELLSGRRPYELPGKKGGPHEVLARILGGPCLPLSEIDAGIPSELQAIVERAMAYDAQQRYARTWDLRNDLSAFLDRRVVSAYETGAWAEARKWIHRNRALSGALAAAIVFLILGLGTSMVFKSRSDENARKANLIALELGIEKQSLAGANASLAQQKVQLTKANAELGEQKAKLTEANAGLLLSEEEARAATLLAVNREGEAIAAKLAEQKRSAELELITEFQSAFLRDVSPERMGREILENQRSRIRAGLIKQGASEAEVQSQLATFAELSAHSNSTDLALTVLGESILGRVAGAIEVEFADQPLVRASLRSSLARTYNELGLYEPALPLMEAALATYRNALGSDHPDTLKSITGMGELQFRLGNYEASIAFFSEALDGRRRILGSEHPNTLTSIGNLANAYFAIGDFEKAKLLGREDLETSMRVLSGNDPHTLSSIHNMGSLLMGMGKLQQAEGYFRQALIGRRQALGSDHPTTLNSLTKLGNALGLLGKNQEALPLFREVLESRRRVHGNEHPRTLTAMQNLGMRLHAIGQHNEADLLVSEALAGYRRVLGDDHPMTLTSINNYGTVLLGMGRILSAKQHFQAGLEARRRILGENHLDTLTSLSNLGVVHNQMGDYLNAELCMREAYAGWRAALGDAHPKTLVMLHNMGDLLLDLERPAEAEPYWRGALKGNRLTYGNDKGLTLLSAGKLGESLRKQQKFKEARPFMKEALQGYVRTKGENHPDTIRALHNMGVISMDLGELEEALPYFQRAVKAGRISLPQGDLDLATFLQHQGRVLRKLKRFVDAEESFLEAYSIMEEGLGLKHVQAVGIAKELVQLYTDWHAAEPDAGYDSELPEWRALANAD